MHLGLALLSCALAAPGTCHASEPAGSHAYALDLTARAGETVRLTALDVPPGWIASFCTNRVCAPFHVAVPLTSGRGAIEIAYYQTGAHPAALHAVHVIARSASGRADLRRAVVR